MWFYDLSTRTTRREPPAHIALFGELNVRLVAREAKVA
jgi:hypothetical protein